ncbi:hypothetical protein EI94DRAFT_1804576 [Lactarius quietus]|nr:hypothetical protein EI94DRAFT_1804576 [Lactarius quietus]
MLFNNIFFSFIAALALASGATAAVTPHWDTNPPPQPAPPPSPPSTTTVNANCNAVGGTCCNQVAPANQVDDGSGGLLSVLDFLDSDNANIGLNCAVVIDSCNVNSFCCSSSQDVSSLGLLNGITGVVGGNCNQILS